MAKNHFILGLLWISYCALHSILASTKAKQLALKLLKSHFKFYRLYYTLYAFVGLLLILYYMVLSPSYFLFDRSLFTYVIGSVMGAAGLITMLICIKKYFTQVSGLRSLFLAEKSSDELMITGIHHYLRHPLYAGTFLFIWGLWLLLPLLSFLVTNIIITFYTIIAIQWEEQKLENVFGESYRNYKQKVPKLIPSLKFNRRIV